MAALPRVEGQGLSAGETISEQRVIRWSSLLSSCREPPMTDTTTGH